MGTETLERIDMSGRVPQILVNFAVRVLLLSGAAGALTHTTRAAENVAADDIIVVVGAEGTEEYGEPFRQWAANWESLAKQAGANFQQIGIDPVSQPSDRELLSDAIDRAHTPHASRLWIVLIGHGTFTRGEAKFNLRGPDLSATEFSQWLQVLERPLVVVNNTSSSGPFIQALSGPGRVIITATKSGAEQNFARFGEYFVRALGTADSDLDHDDEVSVLEAFLTAAAETRDFYQSAARIASEHPLIDDNGDARGTPPTMFRAVRPVGIDKDGVELDGTKASRVTLATFATRLPLSAEQAAQRDSLEQQIDQLRGRRDQVTESAYLEQIEPLLVQLAELYRDAEAGETPGG
jgi:hypothetical protein